MIMLHLCRVSCRVRIKKRKVLWDCQIWSCWTCLCVFYYKMRTTIWSLLQIKKGKVWWDCLLGYDTHVPWCMPLKSTHRQHRKPPYEKYSIITGCGFLKNYEILQFVVKDESVWKTLAWEDAAQLLSQLATFLLSFGQFLPSSLFFFIIA
jgi:hypothetical protein